MGLLGVLTVYSYLVPSNPVFSDSRQTTGRNSTEITTPSTGSCLTNTYVVARFNKLRGKRGEFWVQIRGWALPIHVRIWNVPEIICFFFLWVHIFWSFMEPARRDSTLLLVQLVLAPTCYWTLLSIMGGNMFVGSFANENTMIIWELSIAWQHGEWTKVFFFATIYFSGEKKCYSLWTTESR